MSEAAKLLFEEKNKQLLEKDKSIIELKERVNRLEEKLETKDCESWEIVPQKVKSQMSRISIVNLN